MTPATPPGAKGEGDGMSTVKRKLAEARMRDEKIETDSKTAVTAELFRRCSQDVVSQALNNAIEKFGSIRNPDAK